MMAPYRNSRLGAEDSFFKLESKIFPQIGSALSTTPAPSSLPCAKQISESEEVAKYFAEILHYARIESSRRDAYASMAETIIAGTLLLVGKDGISLRALFESLLCIGIIGITVGMVLHGQLAVRALDLHFRRAPANPQHLVIIAFFVSRQNSYLPS
jgi:hypothetical protein